jgi:tetratricopeptide (TPR) repeat protein
LLRDRGNYEEAETLLRESLEGTKLERELDHPDTLQRMSNLATLFVRQGKYNEAETLTREALDISERVQGPDHPDTLGMVNNLGIALTQLGRYSEAEGMHRRHVEAKKSTLDSSYVGAKINLAVLLDKMGKIEDSAREYEAALDANETLCGEGDSNPTKLNLWSSLGVIYLKQGTLARAEGEHAKATDKFTKAGNMIEKSLRQREILLGETHQLTLITRNNLGGVKQRLGKYAEAQMGFEEVLQLAAKAEMGDDHPFVLRTTNNLGELLRESKINLEHAKDLLNIALAGRERALGASHPDTLTTMYNLAHRLHDGKDFEKAEELYKKALKGLKERLGPDHSTTRDCDKNFRRLLEEKE